MYTCAVFQIKEQALNSFLNTIITVFTSNDCPSSCMFSCSVSDSTQSIRKKKLMDDLRVAIRHNDLLYLVDSDHIWLNLNFTIFTTTDDSPNTTNTVFVDKHGVTPINNHSVKASKRFFRIGTTEV